MVHYSLIKMTNQMIHIMPIKKTTLVIMDMSKLICPNDGMVFFTLVQIQIGYFCIRFASPKSQELY